jgi:SAM-dependent methyltransferase
MDARQYEAHAAYEDVHWWFLARRTILLDIITHLLAGEKGRPLVVDVGCGTGGTVAALAGHYDVLGVEPAAEAVAIARRRHPGCAFVEGTAPEAVAARIAEARVVLLTDVLEHVADDAGLLGSLVSGCRPDTWFVVTVPADMRLWSGHDEVLGHFRRYDPRGFAALWRSLPVACHLLAPFNTRLAPLVRFVRRFRPPGFRGGAAGTDLMLPAAPLNALLYRVFAGESARLVRSLGRGDISGGRSGVSLIAVLRRAPEAAAVTGGGDAPALDDHTLDRQASHAR